MAEIEIIGIIKGNANLRLTSIRSLTIKKEVRIAS